MHDRKQQRTDFIAALQARLAGLREQPATRADFMKEMRRFLPATAVCQSARITGQ